MRTIIGPLIVVLAIAAIVVPVASASAGALPYPHPHPTPAAGSASAADDSGVVIAVVLAGACLLLGALTVVPRRPRLAV
jgi:hypothetical protein